MKFAISSSISSSTNESPLSSRKQRRLNVVKTTRNSFLFALWLSVSVSRSNESACVSCEIARKNHLDEQTLCQSPKTHRHTAKRILCSAHQRRSFLHVHISFNRQNANFSFSRSPYSLNHVKYMEMEFTNILF